MWDTTSGRRLGVFRIESSPIGGVALDSTGDRLAALTRKRRYASNERDGLVVWNVASGDRIIDRDYERVALHSLLFSPEGNRIVLGGDDGKVRFLDTEGGLQDVVLDTETLDVLSLSLASDGSKIVVGTAEELVLLETGPPPGGWAARARASEARGLVDGLYHDLAFAQDVADRLRESTDLPEEIRLAALDLVRIRGDHHGWLNSDATNGYRSTSLSKDELRLILRKAELAHRLWPDHPDYVATLGKCRYRAGSYREAQETMDRAEAMYRSAGGTLDPEDLAFLAMIHWRLGDRESARQSMRSLDSLLADRGDGVGSGAPASLEEARTLVRPTR